MSGKLFFEIKSHVLCDSPFCTNSYRKNSKKIAIHTAVLTVPYVYVNDCHKILFKENLNICLCLNCYDLFYDAQVKEVSVYAHECDESINDILKKAVRKTMFIINKYEINPSRYLLD
jgi:hypothetical protein